MRRRLERGTLVIREAECRAQPLDGVALWSASLAAFQEADCIRAEPGALGQFLLRQVRPVAEAPEEIAEWCLAVRVHHSPVSRPASQHRCWLG